MKKKFAIVIISTLSFLSTFGRQSPIKQDKDSLPFFLAYAFAGLGSSLGTFQPTIKIHDTNFVYTYEQNSFYVERSSRIDTVCIIKFRRTSIDSIFEIVKGLPDTTIFKSHPGIMSGGIHFLSIKNGKDTINFRMMNTFDYTALKIVNILNTYLPKDKQLWANEKMIMDAEEYRANILRKIDADKLKKKKKAH